MAAGPNSCAVGRRPESAGKNNGRRPESVGRRPELTKKNDRRPESVARRPESGARQLPGVRGSLSLLLLVWCLPFLS